MDDLIKRLGIIARAEMSNYAERTVNEAADTIARQQVMLDRALESNGDMMVRIGKLEAALTLASKRLSACARTLDRVSEMRKAALWADEARAALAKTQDTRE